VYDRLGEPQRALQYYTEALPIGREVGDRQGEAAALNNLGAVYDRLGEPQRALQYYTEALPIGREVGDRQGEAATLNNLGLVYHRGLGEPQRALQYFAEALPIQREVGDRRGEAVTRYNIAMIHRDEGRLGEAVEEFEMVVEVDRATQHPDLVSDQAMLDQVRAELETGSS
jgi:tetratricopeptide (TPR) repeat protein